ncbi:AMMECR1 domain-containing protein [Candidatus Woesearchaeota archaeon CG10_big_fil_rev_8_21_14_0_10_44_13]|nr:MAG: AMMECR1 domain-containing protein [Candidatus Woesearchaeota archaeon CG10_big_fil_rev_8_21_14_0_10_44_13]
MFNLEQGKKLVRLARYSIETHFSREKISIEEYKKDFPVKQGVFVTLTKEGELRGCIGFPEPTHQLYRAVFEAARSAAFEDPRFPPLQKKEFDDILIEVSVLSVPELIEVNKPEEYLKKIEIGKDGLIIRGIYGSGLLLPQVPVEWKWDADDFLQQIGVKAGIDQNAWKDIDNKLYKFQAQIFSEKSPKGEVVEKEFDPSP